MERAFLCSLLASAALWSVSDGASGDAFTVSELLLSSLVDDFVSSDIDGIHLWDPNIPNPLQFSQSAALPPNATADTSYDFSWSGQAGLGTFLVDAAHQARDVGGYGLVSASTGRIWISTTQDVTLDVLGIYDYNTPATYFDTEIRISVARADPFEVLLDVAQHGGPFGGNPSSGTLNIGGNVVLPAGDTYIMRYSFSIDSFGGGTNILGTGSGNMSFNITPEPSTLSLLAVAALGCLKRRRSRRRTPAA